MEQSTFKISGMSCGHCLGQVTKVLSSLDGVRIDQVKIGEATIGYEPRQITPSEIAEAINEAGYQAELTGRAI
jgi:copper chaperone